ncbi:hypothetical protein FJZ26_03770 [Candidatus Parvarchaeota archaeon]|nr:hypothetical protein [Candidatus Parvarchaeota archaeon]
MVNITLSVSDTLRLEMNRHNDIRWSEVARNAIVEKIKQLRKLEILRKYVEKEPFSDADLRWMDENDWHPVDERPMKKTFINTLKASRREKSSPTTIDALFK